MSFTCGACLSLCVLLLLTTTPCWCWLATLAGASAAAWPLHCACTPGVTRCAANSTCSVSSRHGYCLRMEATELSVLLGDGAASPFLACADDAGPCSQDGAVCCRSGDLCNLSPPAEWGEKEESDNVDGDLLKLVRVRRFARHLGNLLGGLPKTPPAHRGKLRCLCQDPVSLTKSINGPPCQLSRTNKSVCILPGGGWCSRTWEPVEGGGQRVRDSCLPRRTGIFLCANSGRANMQCCSNRKLCQSTLTPPNEPGQSTEPESETIQLTGPSTDLPSSSPVPNQLPTTIGPGVPFNATRSSGELLRCLCSGTSPGCNRKAGWCFTDGLCYSLKTWTGSGHREEVSFAKCVPRREVGDYLQLCKYDNNRCCDKHCCNHRAVNGSSIVACQLKLTVRPPEPEPSSAPGELTTPPSTFTPVVRCHCSDCVSGFCESASGVCGADFDPIRNTTYQQCISTATLRTFCQTRSLSLIESRRYKAKFTGSSTKNGVYCCARDKCNLCHLGHPTDMCKPNATANCSCTVCGPLQTSCPLPPSGFCYLNGDSNVSHCITRRLSHLCREGSCCTGHMCNMPNITVTDSSLAVTTRSVATASQMTSPTATASEGSKSVPTQNPSGGTRDTAGASSSSTTLSSTIIITIAVSALLVTLTVILVFTMFARYHNSARSRSRAAQHQTVKCTRTLQACSGSQSKKQSSPSSPAPLCEEVTTSEHLLSPVAPSTASEKFDNHSNTSLSLADSNSGNTVSVSLSTST